MDVHTFLHIIDNIPDTSDENKDLTEQEQQHRLTALCPRLPGVSQYQKGKMTLDFTEARDSGWQWHQLGHMQVCTSP